MTPAELAAYATAALAAGKNMSLEGEPGVKMPPKFPRGELLCENSEGTPTYSYNPAIVLEWLAFRGLIEIEGE